MSDFTKSIILLLFLVVFLAACKNKDEEVGPKKVIVFDGVEYQLSNGLLRDYGKLSKDEGHTQSLFLYSQGISTHESNGKFDSTSGKGHVIYFEMFSPVEGLLGDGEYVLDYNTYKPSTFDYSYAIFNADYLARNGDVHEMISGKVTTKKEGDNYSITFDCIQNEGKHITGFYKGPLRYYNEK